MIEKLIINRKDQQVNRTVEYKLPVLPPCGYIITNINRPLFAEVCGGVELGKAQPMVAFEGEAVIFDGRLIHGVGHNRSKRVRFSLDFRVWSKTVAEGAASVRGELLRKMEKNQGAVKGKTGNKAQPVLDDRPKLSDLGITQDAVEPMR